MISIIGWRGPDEGDIKKLSPPPPPPPSDLGDMRSALAFAGSGWRSGERPDCGCEGCRDMAAALSASGERNG